MGKILGVILLGGVAFIVLQQGRVIDWKNQATEKFNAAAKQNRLLEQAQKQLGDLQALASDSSLSKDNLKKAASLIDSTRDTLGQIQQSTNDKDLGATISKLINKIIPGDDPQPTWVPPTVTNCPLPSATPTPSLNK